MGVDWSDIVALTDGYALTGIVLSQQNGLLVRLKKDLEVEFIAEYVDSINFVEYYRKF